jgi:competence protein ComEC
VFIGAVLAFCAGIYLQAVHPLPLGPLLAASAASIGSIAVIYRLLRRAFFLLVPLILVCSLLLGAARLAFVEIGPAASLEDGESTVFEGLVTESSSHVKVLSLNRPVELKGMKVAFVSDAQIDTSQRVRLFGKMIDLVPTFQNPGGGSWKWQKRLEGVTYQIRGRLLSVGSGNDPVARLRRYFKENIEHSGADHIDVLKALTIGDRTAVPRGTDDLFMRTGTTHVLIVSGFKVGVISGFFFVLVRMILGRVRVWRLSGRHSRYAALLAVPFPIMFMLISGAGIPVIRATIMIVTFLIATFLERERHFYHTMALATLIILLLYPHSLMTASFQLTFCGVLSIVIFMKRLFPLLIRFKNRLLAWSISTVLSTASVTVGTAPLVVYYFYGINLLSVVHNLITIPLLTVAATVLSLIGMASPYGLYLLRAAGYITDFNIAILERLDFAYLYPLIRPTPFEILLCYAVMLALLNARRKAVSALLVVVLIPLALFQVYGDYRERFNSDLRVNQIDVGLGDACLIEAPGGVRILIDGGGYPVGDFDMGKQVITPFLLYRKIRHIDYVINTHPHSDHIGGLIHILRHFDVSHVVTAGFFPEEKLFRELMEAAKEKGVDHLVWRRGDGVRGEGFKMDVLYPAPADLGDNLNDTSLVLRLTHGNVAFLFTGDIQADVEEKLVLSGLPLRADVLKVPHHGSSFSNSFPFLYAVRPRLAVVSAGHGQKYLPAPAALERYERLSIPVLGTYRYGLVEVRSDGTNIAWETYVKP